MHPKRDLFKINQRNFCLIWIKDSVDSWILFLTVLIRLSIFYNGRFVFFVRKTVFFCVCSTQDDKKHFYLLNFALCGSFLTQILQKLEKTENWYFWKK
jgi:hypothetical protein